MAEAGEMVGIIAGQGLGEPTTQLTLNSFHHSGIASLASTTQGVPRVKELLSLTRNMKTPQMELYMKKEYMGMQDMAHKIASHIKYTAIEHLRKSLEVFYDPEPNLPNSYMNKDNAVKIFVSNNPTKYSCQTDLNLVPFLIRIVFNRESMYEKEVTLLDIKSKLCNMWEKRMFDKNMIKKDRLLLDKITKLSISSNTDYDDVPIIHIRFNIVVFDINVIRDFCERVLDKFKLKGLSSIKDITAIEEKKTITFNEEDNNKLEKKTNYIIFTKGSNLYDIRYLNNIDLNKTFCNDVNAMYETFGIEAARTTLIREITYAYTRAGSEINYHHVALLVDHMTLNGFMTSVDRHGMTKSEVGPLSRATFERPLDILQQAAVFGESDNMNGVSARIMTGLVIKGGTGLCNVILDTNMIQNSQYTGMGVVEDADTNINFETTEKYADTYTHISGNKIHSDIMRQDTAPNMASAQQDTDEEDNIFIPN